jgi:hypothetical protein
MKTHVVQLERDDDIVSARDKMMWSKAPRILVVWPRRGRVLDRELDLVLLQRQSRQLGAQLAIVTFDEDVITYSRELHIPAFSSVSEAQREVWKTSRRSPEAKQRPPARWSLREMQEWKQQAAKSKGQSTPARLTGFILGVLAVLALGMFLLPGASVSFKLAEEIQRVTLTVTASHGVLTPTVAGVIPVYNTTVIVEGRDQIPASGVLKLSDKRAEGEIEITNLTEESVLVEAGTVVLTLEEPVVRFATIANVTVPSGAGNSVMAGVKASVPGNSGNVAEDTILAMEGSAGLDVSVTNPAPTRGGEDRNVPMPTDLDLTRLRERLLSSLKESARMDLERMLGENKTLIVDSLDVKEVVSEQQEPQTGEPGDYLSLTLQAEYKAQYIERADLETVARLALDASLPEGYTASSDTLQLVIVKQTKASAAASEWQVVAERSIQANWQRETMIRAILGAKPVQVGQILAKQFALEGVPQVHISPKWWPRMPYLPLRIQLEEE